MRIRQVDTNNLTEFTAFVAHIIGQKWLRSNTFNTVRDYMQVRKETEKRVRDQVRKMSSEKLGWICGHSTYYGVHNDYAGQRPRFINLIGLLDMTERDVKEVMPNDKFNRPFREIMETTATLTIIAFAIDTVVQDHRKEQWGVEGF